MTRSLHCAHRQLARAMTLVELIVVISIISITAAVTIPMFSSLDRFFDDQSGLNTVQVAVMAARTYAMRNIANITVSSSDATYSGCAVIFCPNGELRLVENDQIAKSTTGGALEDAPAYRNGFRDLPGREYLKLPRDVGVLGISRDSSGLRLLEPPFAVRFSEQGYLVTSAVTPTSSSEEIAQVFYDANGDGRYDLSTGAGSTRNNPYTGGSYDLDVWDANSDQYIPTDDRSNNPGRHPDLLKEKLPFEELEAVTGLLIYSKRKFREDGGDWPATYPGEGCGISGGAPCTSIDEWMLANGRAVFFSRYSGALLREKSE